MEDPSHCKPHVKCIVKCALDATCLEMNAYLELLKRSGTDIETLAGELGKDDNTVYKALKGLMDKGLVRRDYRILRNGGYKHIYTPLPFEEFKKVTKERLEKWINDVANILELVENMDENEFIKE